MRASLIVGLAGAVAFVVFAEASAQASYQPGQTVEMLLGGTWRRATVIRMQDGQVLTRMDNGTGVSGSVDLSTLDHVRPVGAPVAADRRVAPPQPAPAAQAPAATVLAGSCPVGGPDGDAGKGAPPSASTFERVIYNFLSAAQRGQFGMTFTSFQMSGTSKNSVINNGRGAERQYPNVPLGATVYAVKATYVTCNSDAHTVIRSTFKAEYACMKDQFGDWTCPTTSSARTDYKLTTARPPSRQRPTVRFPAKTDIRTAAESGH